MNFESLFNERLRENDEFNKIVIQPSAAQFSEIEELIEMFPDLMSVDYVSEDFLKLLGGLVGYEYQDTEDPEVQREIIKRVRIMYNERGSEKQILQTLYYGHDDRYVGSLMTFYRGMIEKKSGSITSNEGLVFTYDKSYFDSNHRWIDFQIYTPGVIDLAGSDINERTITRLDAVVPGGIRWNISYLHDMGGGGEYGEIYRGIATVDASNDLYIDHIAQAYFSEPGFRWDKSRWDSFDEGRSPVTYEQFTENEAPLAFYDKLLPSDKGYCVGGYADQKYIYNERTRIE